MPACKAIRGAELRAICPTCASSVLASKSNIGAHLRAPCGVRMVWWGFGALKTPRRASSLPTLLASAAWLQSGYKRETEGLHFDCKKAALALHRGCTNAALMLHLCCTGAADQGAAGSMPADRAAQEERRKE